MTTLQIEKLTVTEKLQIMESLWDSLCAKAENIAIPAWHDEVLQERQNALNRGIDTFVGWNEAKMHIRNQLS